MEIELQLRRITDDQRIPGKMMYEVDEIDFVHHFSGPICDRLSRYEIGGAVTEIAIR
jgi:hypothetical protein